MGQANLPTFQALERGWEEGKAQLRKLLLSPSLDERIIFIFHCPISNDL